MSGGLITVLYAEDDENDAFLMQRAFRKIPLPHQLEIVSHGQAALDYIFGVGPFSDRAAHPLPSLVILDLKMPQVSGLGVLREVRKRFPDFAVPIVMLTSSAQSWDIKTAEELKAAAYLVKSPSTEKLSEVLQTLHETYLAEFKSTLGPIPGDQLKHT